MSNYYKRREQKTVLESIFIGIFKAIWWLVKLPFGGKRKKVGFSSEDRNFIIKKRQELEGLLESTSKIDLVHALMESDKIVDHIFKLRGYQGESFAERLRFAENRMDQSMYSRLWQAHKVRNRVVHEADDNIHNQEIKNATVILIQYIKNV